MANNIFDKLSTYFIPFGIILDGIIPKGIK